MMRDKSKLTFIWTSFFGWEDGSSGKKEVIDTRTRKLDRPKN